jgi:hypothetical protein
VRGFKILFVSLRLGKRGQLFLQTEPTETRERSQRSRAVVRVLKLLHDLKRKKMCSESDKIGEWVYTLNGKAWRNSR